VATSSTTTSTQRQCGFRGNSCKGSCPLNLRCATVVEGLELLCTCVPL
jgi:hypothetical protein